MSVDVVRELVAQLPRSLSNQIIGYAESVERATPDIFREAKRERTPQLEREVIFIAGIKKLHWLAASSYWTLESSGKLLASHDVAKIRIGGADASLDGGIHNALRTLLVDLDNTLRERDLFKYLLMPWSEVVRELTSDGR